jgi:hypothetical protein
MSVWMLTRDVRDRAAEGQWNLRIAGCHQRFVVRLELVALGERRESLGSDERILVLRVSA